MFGSPFVGLLLYRFGGATAVLDRHLRAAGRRDDHPRLRAPARARIGADRGDARERRRRHRLAAVEHPAAHDRLGQPQLERLRRCGDRHHARRPPRAPRDERDHGERDVHRRRDRRRRADAPARSHGAAPVRRRARRSSSRSRSRRPRSSSSPTPAPRSSGRSSTASSCSRTAPQRHRSTAPAPPRSSTTTRGSSTWRCSRSG